MTEKKLYTCDICHTDYNSKEAAQKCEKEHKRIDTVKDFRYNAHSPYPTKIHVKFTDGTTQWYRM